jgi:hypothetical protein
MGRFLSCAVEGVDQLHFETHRVELTLHLGTHLLQQKASFLLKVCGINDMLCGRASLSVLLAPRESEEKFLTYLLRWKIKMLLELGAQATAAPRRVGR